MHQLFCLQVSYLSPKNIIVALSFVRQAEAACKEQSKCLWRVQQWGLSIMYMVLWRYDEVDALPDSAALLPTKLATWLQFRSVAERMGVRNFKALEGYGLSWMCGYMFRGNATENATACS